MLVRIKGLCQEWGPSGTHGFREKFFFFHVDGRHRWCFNEAMFWWYIMLWCLFTAFIYTFLVTVLSWSRASGIGQAFRRGMWDLLNFL